jgi:undecaprenyl-diphosphatase
MTPAGWDVAIFRAIHLGWLRQPWIDPVMAFLTDPGPWKFPILGAVALLFLLRGRRGVIGLVVLALTVAAADQLSSHIIKPLVHRARPSAALPDARPIFGIRGTNSFPSTHAVNFFAAAPVVSAVFPEGIMAAYAVAGAVSLSRVYVGDHYPSDVVAGAVLGLWLGLLGRRAYRRLVRTLVPSREAMPKEEERAEPEPSGVP